jgi:hypothetical protein
VNRSSCGLLAAISFVAVPAALACGSDPEPSSSPDASISLGDGGFVDAPDPDADKGRVDGGFLGPDGSVVPLHRFATAVKSFTPGTCAGFGDKELVLGPPVGAGELKGSLDVLALGAGGEIVLSFEPNAIVDGPGPDFIVFENAFYAGGNKDQPVADLGEVSVSEDGTTWVPFPCTASAAPPYGACAGWHPVYSAPNNGISPFDPAKAGGEAYDLATVGLTKARFVKITDKATEPCNVTPKPNNAGFDLDAIAIVNGEKP